MIPVRLELTNFLSYRTTAELDFTGINLACISGENGAGKSTLLDAITWALFNKARRTDDAIIHGDQDTCKVILDFYYEDTLYRIQREKTRGKSGVVYFYARDAKEEKWNPLGERGIRDTDKVIQQVLRMDYETFINASFFLQGKADQFATQKPSDRKRILSSILGLEIWDRYKDRTIEKRKLLERDLHSLDGRLAEIQQELAEEEPRKQRLKELEETWQAVQQRKVEQEARVSQFRRMEESVRNQKKTLDMLRDQLESSSQKLTALQERHSKRLNEQKSFQEILNQADDVTRHYQTWQKTREELDQWNELAAKAAGIEKQKSAPLMTIEKERGALEQEQQNLLRQQAQALLTANQVPQREKEQKELLLKLEQEQENARKRDNLEAQLEALRNRMGELKSENAVMKAAMNEMDERRKKLEQVHAANCPLCGQGLSTEHRVQLVEEITHEGTTLAEQFRANQDTIKKLEVELAEIQASLTGIAAAEKRIHDLQREIDQLNAWLEHNTTLVQDWQGIGEQRLTTVQQALEGNLFALDARDALEKLNQNTRQLGYDAQKHAEIRQQESSLRHSADEYQKLESARSTLEPITREIGDMEEQLTAIQAEISDRTEAVEKTAAIYDDLSSQLTEMHTAEEQLKEMVERESEVNRELGAARQNMDVIPVLKKRVKELDQEREEITYKISQYKKLEKAFGKDGVPALLIEQALPEIENEANDILDRLSAGAMNIRFQTRRDLKTRDEKRETLDILISDPNGLRDYELFSGGEAFRVNFAIRLALSKVLAKRAGARLQTLVVDEGFGSQDATGRQRLIEAINLVKENFSCVLVITHLDELKDAFPKRIEVEKTVQGSAIQVI